MVVMMNIIIMMIVVMLVTMIMILQVLRLTFLVQGGFLSAMTIFLRDMPLGDLLVTNLSMLSFLLIQEISAAIPSLNSLTALLTA